METTERGREDAGIEEFEEGPPRTAPDDDGFLLDLGAWEGPLDLLLDLAESRRIDLRAVSVLEIADQFLDFVRRARAVRLELAADWLVMAVTLAYLKSRLLLPAPRDEREAARHAAEDLTLRLARMASIRAIAEDLATRRRLGVDWHGTGDPSDAPALRTRRLASTFHALLRAYVREARPVLAPAPAYVPRPLALFPIDEALRRLDEILDPSRWQDLVELIPVGRVSAPVETRSRIASHYVAILEMAKRGLAEVRQDGPVVSARAASREAAT